MPTASTAPPVATITVRRGRPRAAGRPIVGDPRTEILVAASRLFSTKGVEATTVTEIAEVIGIRSASVYYYFHGRDEIVRTLLEYVVQESAPFAVLQAAAPGPPSDRLHRLIAHHIARLIEGPYDLWFVAAYSNNDRPEKQAVMRKATAWRRSVAKLIAEGSDQGEFAPMKAGFGMAVVIGIIYGALMHRHDGHTINPEFVADATLRALGYAGPQRAD